MKLMSGGRHCMDQLSMRDAERVVKGSPAKKAATCAMNARDQDHMRVIGCGVPRGGGRPGRMERCPREAARRFQAIFALSPNGVRAHPAPRQS